MSVEIPRNAPSAGPVQDRLEQRRFLAERKAPQVRHVAVADPSSLAMAAAEVGLPAVLKTRRAGYDGKGQALIAQQADLEAAWRTLGGAPSVLEAFVDFEREISVLVARSANGETRLFPVPENAHRRHVLRTSRVPARVPPAIVIRAEALANDIATELGHVGVMAIEFFVGRGGELLVNEIAPRTHNSGHYTLGACATSQFEQHVRTRHSRNRATTRASSPASSARYLVAIPASVSTPTRMALPTMTPAPTAERWA